MLSLVDQAPSRQRVSWRITTRLLIVAALGLAGALTPYIAANATESQHSRVMDPPGSFIVPATGIVYGQVGGYCNGAEDPPPPHAAWDISNSNGGQIVAAAGGTVTFAGLTNGNHGYEVRISHGNGWVSYYSHLSPTMLVSAHETVTQGQQIAWMSGTSTGGAIGYGIHLHFELRQNGVAYQPWNSYFTCYRNVTRGATISGVATVSWVTAFQDVGGRLFVVESGNKNTSTNLNQGMENTTSPDITRVSDGTWVAAFQANNHNFYTYAQQANSTNHGVAMAPDASPSIAALSGGSWVAAFRASDGQLAVVSPSFPNLVHYSGQQIRAGTNPSIVGRPTANGWTVAFQGTDGNLYTYDHLTALTATGQGMSANTSPSIALRSNGNPVVAFRTNSGSLIVWWPGGGQVTNQPVAASTSPSIAVAADGNNYGVIYVTPSNSLSQWTYTDGNWPTSFGPLVGTSPSVRYLSDGSLRAAFQANVGELFEYSSNSGGTAFDLDQGMRPGTSPAIG